MKRPAVVTANFGLLIMQATSPSNRQAILESATVRSSNRDAVDDNSFVPKKRPFVCWSFSTRVAHGIIASSLVMVIQDMTHNRPLKTLSVVNASETLALHTTRLSGEQLERLSRCAKGISLRFEAPEIVDALVAGGYAEQGVAGIVTVTAKGHQYLRMHAS